MQIVADGAECLILREDPLVIVVCRNSLSMASFDTVRLQLEAVARYKVGMDLEDLVPVGLMIVMESDASPPEIEVRTAINDWTKKGGHHLLNRGGLSVVVEKSGLWGTTVRVVARTIQLGNRATYPTDLFDTADEAIQFHARLLPQIDVGGISRKLHQARGGLLSAS